MKYKLSICGIILLFIIGSALVLYPVVSEMSNRRLQEKITEEYSTNIESSTQQRIGEELKEAQEYNDYLRLGSVVITDPFVEGPDYPLEEKYDEILDVGGNGVMGYIDIPKIDVYMAIYHTTDDEVMQKGVGHLPQTSLPIGGQGTHAVLSSHSGLKKAKLFSDLDELEIGDEFYIHVLDDVLAYEVNQIKTVLPDDIDDLKINDNKDYVTLLTCTPYGVNTHRLLVRGSRVQYHGEDYNSGETEETVLPYGWQSIMIMAISMGMVLIIFAVTRKKKRHE